MHEIAHALVGPKHGHDDIWKTVCRRIGARPVRCYSLDTVDMPKGRWKAQCNSCKKEFHRHRKPKHNGYLHCRSCGPVNGSLTYIA
jgi:predicted SprT family Zn-dependent metalloprotease